MTVSSEISEGVHPSAHPPAAQVVPLANAAAAVGVALYLLCAVAAAIAPPVYIAFFQSWSHGLDLGAIGSAPQIDPGQLAFGLITFTGSVWVVVAAVAALYNRWVRQ